MAAEENNQVEEEIKTAEETAEDTAQEATEAEETVEGTVEDTEEVQEEAEEQSEETEADEKKEKKRFGKKKKAKKDPKDEKIEDLTDKLTRQMAEFDNYRKRTEKEKSSMYIIGAKEIVEKLLPVVDNFERGLAVPEAVEGDPFVDGMNMIYKQMLTVLDEMGVKAIEAVGQEFDPNFHNAVMHVEDDTVGENVVVEEFQKGYTYKDFVVRHSMVKVAN
ncbi:MAG: nucleotide exchange factor GrpE [Lachnospiraceae bacterium]|nr:nucleotide exchange factor GrpE [Lachnospiraceae bacterium]MDD3615210.1 nucleotide exchange factor GrpE [Lachnospiraceae bacterium]